MSSDLASPSSGPHGVHNDTTFRSYSTAQAQEYARRRGGYPPRLIDEIVYLHAQIGGALDSLLDLGCGPGSATRDLATHFNNATGIDPSAEMVTSAKAIGGDARASPIQFLRGEAEVCADIPDQSIDLITAATSAHWFDMERFWPTAARVLKPNGTVAIFTIWRTHCDPAATPHAKQIHEILNELEQGPDALGPYQKPGNWSLMGLYHDLQMPWTISPPCADFRESGYQRQVWSENGEPEADGSYVSGKKDMTLEDEEKAIATISAVTRWREAHPKLAHTEEDCVRVAFAKIRRLLETTGTEKLTMVGPSVLVTVKKQ